MRRCRVAPAVCSTPIHIACEGESVAPALQDLLHEFPDLIILIEGHVDHRGPIGHTERLPLKRAEAVQRGDSADSMDGDGRAALAAALRRILRIGRRWRKKPYDHQEQTGEGAPSRSGR